MVHIYVCVRCLATHTFFLEHTAYRVIECGRGCTLLTDPLKAHFTEIMNSLTDRNPSAYGIITHPFWGNYGGMLQAYALGRATAALNIATCVSVSEQERRRMKESTAMKRESPLRFWRHYARILMGCKKLDLKVFYIVERLKAQKFQLRHIHSTGKLPPPLEASMKGFIVGSDQVWRCRYARYLETVEYYFCDFATEQQRHNSISYAASFGSDEWEGTPEETERCRKLLQQFKAVSVREYSGVRICKDVFGVDAVQMPDPTLLATLEDYEAIIRASRTRVPRGKYLSVYLLDSPPKKAQYLEQIDDSMGMVHQELLAFVRAPERRDRFPYPVAQWLRFIRDCEAVITDSFHGCVFSIIFNKPFVCLGNEQRGTARFDSLLSTYGLQNRLVSDAGPEEVVRVLKQPIDWNYVNGIHEKERARGLEFLKVNLSTTSTQQEDERRDQIHHRPR